MIRIEIDGVATEAEAGATIIQVADKLEIPIPRFCYHRKLSVAANCRMCLVDVEKSPKALPACATPIADGMKIWTKSKAAIDAQKSVMEFLLINHPLDCPICDQGGECELQDVSMEYGAGNSRYTEAKRVVLDENLGPLIATDMTRCILCTRCVRFGQEIAGERELGVTGRGEFAEIKSFLAQHVNSEVSGNIIDLCPVGALTSKPFRFTARAWELEQYNGVSPHDCIGSNLYLHVLNNQVMRVVPKNAVDINEIWLSDRDRFSYQALRHVDRISTPLLHKDNQWQTVSWIEALQYALAGIKLVTENYGADQLGVLAAPNASVEEYYLLQQLTRGLGSPNIDHRLRQQDFSAQEAAPLYPNLGIDFKDLAQQDAVLLIGSHIHKEQPVAGLELRKMILNGGKVCIVNPVDFAFNFAVSAKNIVTGGDMLSALAGIAKELLNLTNNIDVQINITPTPADKKIAAELLGAGSDRLIILGQLALMHPQASTLINLGNLIARLVQGKFGVLSDGANAAGAWLAGCVPHRLPGGTPAEVNGKTALEMLQAPLKCYILYALEPEFDSLLGEQALRTLHQADFVVVLSAYQSATLLSIADVILPIAPYAESAGTMVNASGTWQSNKAATQPFADSRCGWKVLRVLGNLAELPDFLYNSTAEIIAALQAKLITAGATQLLPTWQWQPQSHISIPAAPRGLTRIAPIALYASDSLVRRATALQATQDAITKPTAQLHPETASNLGIKHGDRVEINSATGNAVLSAEINATIPLDSVLIYQANAHTNSLGMPYASVEVKLC